VDDVIAFCKLKYILFLLFFNPLFRLFRKFESLFCRPPGIAPLYPNYSSNNFHLMQDGFSESDALIDCTRLENEYHYLYRKLDSSRPPRNWNAWCVRRCNYILKSFLPNTQSDRLISRESDNTFSGLLRKYRNRSISPATSW
jgi:hypothetical protein